MMACCDALLMIHDSVSVANNFVHSSTAADQGYNAFGEPARFVYCLLQKIKKASSLPLVEKWEEYVVPIIRGSLPLTTRTFLLVPV